MGVVRIHWRYNISLELDWRHIVGTNIISRDSMGRLKAGNTASVRVSRLMWLTICTRGLLLGRDNNRLVTYK